MPPTFLLFVGALALAPVGGIAAVLLLIGLGTRRYRLLAFSLLRRCAIGAIVPVVVMVSLLAVFGIPGGGHRGPLALLGPASVLFLDSFGALSIILGSAEYWKRRRTRSTE